MSLTAPDNPPPEQHPALTQRDWPEPWMAPFVAMLARIPNVSSACRVAGVSRETAYQHRRHDEAFAAAWAEAREVGVDQLETIAHRRATVGEERRVVRTTTRLDAAGNVVERQTVEEVTTHIDNQVLMRLLTGYRPEVWGAEVNHRHTGAEGGPIQVEVMRWPDRERAAELLRLHAEEQGLEVIDGSLAAPVELGPAVAGSDEAET